MTDSFPEPSLSVKRGIRALLRGERPAGDAPSPTIDDALRRYECGGYLHGLWAKDGRTDTLTGGWAEALSRAQRKTAVDTLAALGEFRITGRLLADAGIPFLLLKGAAYLVDLYEDPSERVLADVDLLMRRADVGVAARLLAEAGYRPVAQDYLPIYRRFQMERPGPQPCRIEIHWRIGLPLRSRIPQEAVWERAVPCVLEGIACRRLHPEDAMVYHAVHLADHYFGPSLKWTIDVRRMLRLWRLDPQALAAQSAAWRARTALHLVLRHLAKLFPDDPPPRDLLTATAPGRSRERLLARYLSDDPLALFSNAPSRRIERQTLRCLMVDRPVDVAGLALEALLRPAWERLGRAFVRSTPPWEWRD